MKERRLRRLLKAWDRIKGLVGFGLRAGSSMASDEDRARRMRTAAEVVTHLGPIDPHEEQLRRDYGVDPDVPR